MPQAAMQGRPRRSQSVAPLQVSEPVEELNQIQVAWQRQRWVGLHRDRIGRIVIVAGALSVGMLIRIYGSSVRYHQKQRYVALNRQLTDTRFQLAQVQARQAHLLSPVGVAQAASDEGMVPANTASAIRVP